VALTSIANSTAGGGKAQEATASTYKTQISWGNSSNASTTAGFGGPRRSRLYDILVGFPSTPGDTAIELDVLRVSLGSTPSGITPISSLSSNFMLDPADQGFTSFASINSSAEVGITALAAEPWYLPLNQRASYRWICNPGSEIVVAAVSSGSGNNGLAFRGRSTSYTGTIGVTNFFNES